ncbi:MAG: dephospho-CoA kinase [Bacteroidetes bacterium]|nr:MAG: dephospho-CoA kinase [Bacteroidota bacterium]
MKKIGLTGGIGCGKSYVAEIFRKLGIPVYEADAEARLLQQHDPALKNAIAGLFGKNIYLPDGMLDRKKVAEQVFSDPEKMNRLNALVHPAVARHFETWIAENAETPYIIKEAAILFESGAYRQTDAVIVVTAPTDLRIARVMKRDGAGREEVEKRMKAQWTEEEKIKLAQFVIRNDEKELLIPQVLRIHEELMK